MDQLPIKASLAGSVRPFELRDDEGVGEETAFLYDARLRVLVMQRNRFGVSSAAFAEYLEKKCDLLDEVDFEAILTRDTMQRLLRMQVIRRLDIGFAGPDNGAFFDDRDAAVASILRLQNEFAAPRVTMSLSMGHQRGTLPLRHAMDTLQSLISRRPADDRQLCKLQLSGRTVDGEKDALDLIEGRMIEEMDLDLGDARTARYPLRHSALMAAWEKRRSELQEMFSEQEG